MFPFLDSYPKMESFGVGGVTPGSGYAARLASLARSTSSAAAAQSGQSTTARPTWSRDSDGSDSIESASDSDATQDSAVSDGANDEAHGLDQRQRSPKRTMSMEARRALAREKGIHITKHAL